MSVSTDVRDYALYWNGHVTRKETEHNGRRHEELDGEVVHTIGLARVYAWRWLEPHPTHPRPGDCTQYVHVDVVVNGRLVSLDEQRTASDAIRTPMGLKRRALRWLRELEAA